MVVGGGEGHPARSEESTLGTPGMLLAWVACLYKVRGPALCGQGSTVRQEAGKEAGSHALLGEPHSPSH